MVAYVRTTSTSNYSSSEGVSSRAARPTEAFLSRGSAMEHGHYAESPSNSGSKPKEEEGSEKEREEGRVRGLTLNLETLRADEPPQGYLKDDGARRRFLVLAFRRPERHSDFAFSFPRMERNDIYNWNILLGWIFLDILVLEQYRLSPRQDQTNFPAFLTRISGNCDVSIDYYIASVTSYSFRNYPIRFAKGERLIEPAITKNRIFMDRLVLKFFNAAVAVPFVFQFNAAFYYRATTRAHPMKNILRVRVLHLTKNKLL